MPPLIEAPKKASSPPVTRSKERLKRSRRTASRKRQREGVIKYTRPVSTLVLSFGSLLTEALEEERKEGNKAFSLLKLAAFSASYHIIIRSVNIVTFSPGYRRVCVP
jgi:hypothetical protein